MKAKNTIVLVLIALGLYVFIYFYERHTKTSSEESERAGRVVEVDRDKVTAMTIKNPETRIDLVKRDNQWYIDSPVKDRADSVVISTLFTTLEGLRHIAEINGAKDQLKEYGLADPGMKVILTVEKEKPIEIDIGKDAVVDGKVFAMVAGSNSVEVIPNDLKTQVSKKTDDFRDRKLADLTTQQVSKIDVKSASGDLELEKKNSHWSIAKPLQARGDDSKINDLVAQASTAHVDQFITDQNLASYGLAEPRGTITFSIEGSDKPISLAIGSSPKEEKDKDKVYVKLSTREGLTLVAKAPVEALLNTKPNEIRDKNLVRVESDIVDRINIEPGGRPKIVLARKGESWVRKDGAKDVTINEAPAKQILTALQGAQVTAFISDVATDLPKYGLDQPPLKVTLSSFASENTAETNAGEKPIVSILFGRIDGDIIFAKLEDEPFVVSTQKSILDSIPADPLLYQDLTIYKLKPDNITNVEVARSGQPALAVERDKEKGWKLAKADGTLNQGTVKSLITTLADLRAVRWVDPATPGQGLDKPTVVVTFTSAEGDKKTQNKLTVGAAKSDDQWFAAADGITGSFLISRADENALLLPLTDKDAGTKPPAVASGAPPAASTSVPAAPEPVPVPSTPPPAPADAPAASATPPPAPAAPSAQSGEKPAPAAQ